MKSFLKAKRPPGKMTKDELREEMDELEDLWIEKALSDEEIQIVNDVLPSKKKEDVQIGMAPQAKRKVRLF